jgi:hypothetical protein
MNISSSELEEICKSLLQKTVYFTIRNKVLKKGKIELFVQRNFYIIFHLLTDKNKKEKLEIPIPFLYENHIEDGLIYFDYRIKSLSKYCPEAEHVLINLLEKTNKKNKFGDVILVIEETKNE